MARHHDRVLPAGVLTWRIGWHLETCPAPLPRADTAAAWQMLAWTLKAAEDNGTPAETLIRHARHIRSLHDLAQAAQAAARPRQDKRPAGLPPWLTPPPSHPATSGPATDGLPRYLADAAALIASRIRHLAQTADRERPAWMNLLGQPHPGTARHQQWLTHIAVIAAYRDQSRHHHHRPPPGPRPYPEPGRAGHAVYWHAAQSVYTARHLADLETNYQPDPVRAHAAADIYHALPGTEQAAIRSAMDTRPGQFRLGTGIIDDETLTHPAHAAHLIKALTQARHLTPSFAPHRRHSGNDDTEQLEAALVRRNAAGTLHARDPNPSRCTFKPSHTRSGTPAPTPSAR